MSHIHSFHEILIDKQKYLHVSGMWSRILRYKSSDDGLNVNHGFISGSRVPEEEYRPDAKGVVRGRRKRSLKY